jgi:hypothetical protein
MFSDRSGLTIGTGSFFAGRDAKRTDTTSYESHLRRVQGITVMVASFERMPASETWSLWSPGATWGTRKLTWYAPPKLGARPANITSLATPSKIA